MGKALQRLSMLFGLLLYFFDYGSDIYVANKYWQNGDVWWFGLTVGLIVGPSIIVNITAIIQVTNYFLCFAAVFQLSIIFRYFETIWKPESPRIYSLAKLRYLETITESAPQWCLQGYIMLRQWKFPTYTIVSIALSLFSLAWSITTLDKARRHNEEEKFELKSQSTTSLEQAPRDQRRGKFGICYAFCFLLWQLSTLIPRLSAITIFVYVFRYYVAILLSTHYIIQGVEILIIQVALGRKFWPSLGWSLLASFPTMFHASETVLPTGKPRVEMIVGYVLIVLETIVMVILSLTVQIPDAPHMDVLKPIAIGLIIGGLTLSLIFAMNFYCFPTTTLERNTTEQRVQGHDNSVE